MSGRNKTPMVGWHPSADLWPRLKAVIEHRAGRRSDRRGVQSEVLNEAVREFLDRHETTTSPEGEK